MGKVITLTSDAHLASFSYFKFHGHQSTGSGEEGFKRFLPYMGKTATLVM